MYENNYNYDYVSAEEIKDNNSPENKNPKDKKPFGKIIAALLAVVILGGASGYAGAYLQNKQNEDSVSVSADTQAEKTSNSSDDTASVTEATTTASDSSNDTKAVSSLLTSSSKGDTALSTEEIFQKVSPSVVCVHSEFDSESGTGTGIILSSDGYIITNAHVVETSETESTYSGNNGYNSFDPYSFFFGYGNGWGSSSEQKTVVKQANKVTVILSDESETEYEATIVGTDTVSDLAVLKIDAENLSAAEFGSSDDLQIGESAYAIGYPMGLGLSMSEGIISGLNREISVELTSGGSATMILIQTDTAINPGNSGGPLINEYGQVVGITSSKLAVTSVEGMGFAIPITDAMPLINDLMNQGYVEHHTPQFGITGSNITAAVKRYYGLPVDSGVLVVSVEEGSGAESAGICEGDVIIAADGKEITSMDDLTEVKNGKEVGDQVVLTLARNNGNEEVTVTLTEAKTEETEEQQTESAS